jgi:hypothetical protein
MFQPIFVFPYPTGETSNRSQGGGNGVTADLVAVLTVAGISAVELWAGIAAGFAFGLHPLLIVLIPAAVTIAVVIVFVALGERLLKGRALKKRERLERILHRYGAPGLGLLAPLTVGAPLAAALGVALHLPTRPLLFWLCLGVIVWAIGLVAAGMLGLSLWGF